MGKVLVAILITLVLIILFGSAFLWYFYKDECLKFIDWLMGCKSISEKRQTAFNKKSTRTIKVSGKSSGEKSYPIRPLRVKTGEISNLSTKRLASVTPTPDVEEDSTFDKTTSS